MRDPNRRARRLLAQDTRGLGMRREHVVEGEARGTRVREARRDLGVEETSEEKNERLVERQVEAHVGRQRARGFPREAREGVDRSGRGPRRLRVEPPGVGVVTERHDRLEAVRDEALDEAAVARER